uniref:Ig-like domain-containing protein n=1 Tax=Seriola lalandi dorsalis TaxID=1841481 RepID=A0A3B4X6H9_SERLL
KARPSEVSKKQSANVVVFPPQLPLMFPVSSVTCGLSPPTIVSNQEEFILQPGSRLNISCTGKRSVVWAEPLPENTFVLPGYFTSTLFIYNATVGNTRYYMCVYEGREGDLQSEEEEEENEAGIYVFVPDPEAAFVPDVPEHLVVPMDSPGVPISCRVSHPHSDVILRSVPGGEEMPAYYDNKMGFFGNLAPGQYQCETAGVNGRTARSDIYTVKIKGEQTQTFWKTTGNTLENW